MNKQIYNTILLLRFPFSLFLLPVTLFSLWLNPHELDSDIWLLIVIWHLLIYPSSNGYNSYNDQDEGPIGGLAKPPQPTKNLLIVANLMDLAAILLSLTIDSIFASTVAIFIIASRLYSYRNIRLKKYPILGYLVVVFFQGFGVFIANTYVIKNTILFSLNDLIAAIISSLFVGTIYPLTQIYQHEADTKDGVKTLSIMLGIKGTFIYAAILFLLVNISMYILLTFKEFVFFAIIMFPSMIYFFYWAFISFKNQIHANFRNTMIMLSSVSLSLNLFFILIMLIS